MKRTATQRNDRRVERTRKALFDALLSLIVEKGYDRTSIKDILAKADIGRATFYAHFYNKDDLLLGRFSLFRLDVGNGRQDGSPCMPNVTGLFRHFAEQRPLYLALRGTDGLDKTLAIARADLTESFEKLIRIRRSGGEAIPDNARFLAQSLTGAFISLVLWWLDENMPESPETMNQWFGQLCERALGARDSKQIAKKRTTDRTRSSSVRR